MDRHITLPKPGASRVAVPAGQPKPKRVRKYRVESRCENCDWEGKISLPRGTLIRKGCRMLDAAACPRCGCNELIRRDIEAEQAATETVEAPPRTFRDLADLIREHEERERRFPQMPTLPQLPLPGPDRSPSTPPRHPYVGDPPQSPDKYGDPQWATNTFSMKDWRRSTTLGDAQLQQAVIANTPPVVMQQSAIAGMRTAPSPSDFGLR